MNAGQIAPTADDGYRYEAFVSYRHVEPDRRWAQWLHSALESYRVPKQLAGRHATRRRIGRVFRDEEELPASADLSREIEEALAQSRFLIVICSPRTPESEWVNKEVETFRELGRGDRILALLIEGEPAVAFPRSLREIRRSVAAPDGQAVDQVDEVEPLAADVRATRPEGRYRLRRLAKLRLLACLLGCRFDDLRQRDQERRLRAVALVGVGFAVLSAMLFGLAALAMYERNLAEERRQEAERSAVQERSAKRQTVSALEKTRAELYFANVVSARREWLGGNAGAAERYLRDCPTELRGWEWHYLMNMCHLSSVRLQTTELMIHLGAFSPDSARYAAPTGSKITVFNAATGEAIATCIGHVNYLMGIALAFSPDGGSIVSVAPKEAPRIWDSVTGQELGRLEDEGNISSSIAYSGDGRHIILWDSFRLTVCDVSTKKSVMELVGQPSHSFKCAAVAPTGDLLAVAQESADDVQLFRLPGDKPVHRLKQPGSAVSCMAFGETARYLATGGTDNVLRIWDTESGVLSREIYTGPLIQLAFVMQNRWLCGVTQARTIRVWDTADLHELFTRPALKQNELSRKGYAFSPDGNSVAMMQQIWRQSEATDVHILCNDHCTGAFSPDSSRIAIGNLFGVIQLWSAKPLKQLNSLSAHESRINSIEYSPDGAVLIAGSEDRTVSVFDSASLEERQRFKHHESGVTSATFSPSGEVIASASRSADVLVWDAKTGEVRLRMTQLGKVAETLRFDRSGRLLFAWFSDTTVRAWNYPQGSEVYDIGGASSIVRAQSQVGICLHPRNDEFAFSHENAILWARNQDGETIRRFSATNQISGLAYSPEGGRLAVENMNSSMELFDSQGRQLLQLPCPLLGTGIGFSPDGALLLATGGTGAWLWDGSREPDSRTMVQPDSLPLRSVAFNPTTSMIATAGWEGAIDCWKPTTGEPGRRWVGHEQVGAELIISPKGTCRTYVRWDDDTVMHRIDVGERVRQFESKFIPARAIVANPDGSQMAVVREGARALGASLGRATNTIELWDASTGKQQRVLVGHQTKVVALRFSHDGAKLLSRSEGGQIIVWDAASGKILREIRVPWSLWAGSGEPMAISPDDHFLATPGEDPQNSLRDQSSNILLIDLENGQTTDVWKLPADPIRGKRNLVDLWFHPHRDLLIVADALGEVTVWDANGKKPLRTIQASDQSLAAIALSPDGNLIATGVWGSQIDTWDIETGQRRQSFVGDNNRLKSIAWSEDGNHLAAVGINGTLVTWQAESAQMERAVLGNQRTIYDAVYNSDGKRLATAGDDQTVRIWNVDDQRLVKVLKGHVGWVLTLAWSPDDATLASAGIDGGIRLWTLPDGQPGPILMGHNGSVQRVKFNADGKRLASCGVDGTIRIWDVKAAKCLSMINAHSGTVQGLSYSPDGSRLASAGSDGRLRLWNSANGQLIRSTAGDAKGLNDVAFSPTGNWLATAGDDRTVRLWIGDSLAPGPVLHGLPAAAVSVGIHRDGLMLAACASDQLRLWTLSPNDTTCETNPELGEEETIIARGVLARDIGDHEQALIHFTRLAEVLPDKPDWYWYCAQEMAKLGRTTDSLAQYSKTLAHRGDDALHPARNATMFCERGNRYIEIGAKDKALADFSDAIKLSPSTAIFWHNRASTYQSLKQFGEADADFSKAAKLAPQTIPLLIRRANLNGTMGRWYEALQGYQQAAALDDRNAALLNQAGVAAIRVNDFQLAVKLLDKAVECDPKNSSAFHNLGGARAELGDWDGATQAYDKALAIEPKVLQIWSDAALLAKKQRNANRHEEICREVMQRFAAADDFGVRQGAIWVCQRFGDDSGANLTADMLLSRLNGESADYAGNSLTRAAVCFRHGRYEEAVNLLRAIIDRDDSAMDQRGWSLLAMSLARKGDASASREALGKIDITAIEMDEPRPVHLQAAKKLLWQSRLEIDCLIAEAQSLSGGS